MRLEKWYADTVVDGQAKIRYCANLQVGPLTLGYRSCLGTLRKDVDWRLGGQQLPTLRDTALFWPADYGSMALTLRPAKLRPQRLWQQSDLAVVWDPVVLNGTLSATAGQARGRGYAERLILDGAPWRLGLQTLLWGHFCGGRHSLVWIEWRGPRPRKIALVDGHAVTLLAAGSDRVDAVSAHLQLADTRSIVCQPLGGEALAWLGWLPSGAARRFLAGVERKWISFARLARNGVVVDEGHAIHEEVTWD